MKTKSTFLWGMCALVAFSSAPAVFAAPRVPTNPCPKQHPNIDPSCQQVCQACYQAKFVVGEYRIGDGFWRDCVAPLVTGGQPPRPPTNDGRELPVFPNNMRGAGATCFAKSGKFWEKAKK
jgi:hypothetical protein